MTTSNVNNKNKMQQMNKVIEMFTIFNTKVWDKLDAFDVINISHQEFESTMSELKSYASKLNKHFNLNLGQKVEELKNSWEPLIGFDLDDTDNMAMVIEQYTKVLETAKDIYITLLNVGGITPLINK